jgi:hypothetical protein
MPLKQPQPGASYVPAYQTSAIPYVTSSATLSDVPTAGNSVDPINIKFPYVTKHLTIRNTGANDLRLAFSYSGSFAPGESHNGGEKSAHQHRNYFLIPTGSASANAEATQTFDIRCKEIFLLGDGGTTGFSLIAGLTTINASNFPILSASNSWKGVG